MSFQQFNTIDLTCKWTETFHCSRNIFIQTRCNENLSLHTEFYCQSIHNTLKYVNLLEKLMERNMNLKESIPLVKYNVMFGEKFLFCNKWLLWTWTKSMHSFRNEQKKLEWQYTRNERNYWFLFCLNNKQITRCIQ